MNTIWLLYVAFGTTPSITYDLGADVQAANNNAAKKLIMIDLFIIIFDFFVFNNFDAN